MGRLQISTAVIGLVMTAAGLVAPSVGDDAPAAIDGRMRIPWTTSRITGSPDPPPPYRVERVFPNLSFQQPVEMASFPGTDQIVVLEQRGRCLVFEAASEVREAAVLLDGPTEIEGLRGAYGLAFHPQFSENRRCYLCYILADGRPDGTRVSEFRVIDDDPPRIDPASERVLLTFLSGGHNGGSLQFGPDGYLYISTGDGGPADPPDELATGQDNSDLLSSILRIDVDQHSDSLPYAIPDDNPFVGVAHSRPEIWAYGFRNPWRMSFDRATGDLWVGDVGWQLWELVDRVEKGGNYGWSVREGLQPVRTELTPGPTPVLPPTLALGRMDAASVTGGYVYRGSRLPELVGQYVYGDWVTGKVWGLAVDAQGTATNTELCDTALAIICFHQSPDGELLIADYNQGTLHQLVRNENRGDVAARFPQRLSDTGLFRSTADHLPADGVMPYEVNAPQWLDGATAERFVAIPGTGSASLVRSRATPPSGSEFPVDTVLVRTVSRRLDPDNPATLRRIETQILHYSGLPWRNAGEWTGYTYVWNDEQTDAELAPAAGQELTWTLPGSDSAQSPRQVTYHVHSRAECFTCHNPWAGYRLGFTEEQLDRTIGSAGNVRHQLDELSSLGLIVLPDRAAEQTADATSERSDWISLVDPHAESASLEDRARSYLHANCAHCHRTGGGGTSLIQLDRQVPLSDCRLIGVRPALGTFGLPHPALVTAGDPFASVLYARLTTAGRGHMPYLGAREVDWSGVAVVSDWIASLPLDESSRALTDARIRHAVEQADQILTDTSPAALEETLVTDMLASSYSALVLQSRLRHQPAAGNPQRQTVLRKAARHRDPIIRDLFEQFLPPEERTVRLGNSVDRVAILAMSGNADRGEQLFRRSESLACRKCHRVGTEGTAIGPDLTRIGSLRTPDHLLESILDPSARIEPAYVSYLIETQSGLVHSGLIVSQDADRVLLRTAENVVLDVPRDDIESLVPRQQSLMPDLLFRDLTADELADLLAYLQSLRDDSAP